MNQPASSRIPMLTRVESVTPYVNPLSQDRRERTGIL